MQALDRISRQNNQSPVALQSLLDIVDIMTISKDPTSIKKLGWKAFKIWEEFALTFT